MNHFDPHLHVLPAPQRRLWSELNRVPGTFVLYGGTAAGLWFGHRPSVDFDFFSSNSLVVETLLTQIPFLSGCTLLQAERNTLTVQLEREGPVKVSFFGGLTIGRVREPARARDNGVAVASKLDLAATKARVVVERAERKDYLDLAALLKSGISLTDALGAARALYGEQFNPMITLKALSYFADGDLPKLSDGVKQFLSASQRSADDSSDPSVIGPNRAAEFLMPRGGFSRKRSQRGEAAAEVVTALKRYSVTRLNR